MPVRASVTNGGHEARNDLANDSRDLGKRVRKVAVVDRRTAGVEILSSGGSDGAPSTVPIDDQLTGWRMVGRWPQLTGEEREAREREGPKEGVLRRGDAPRKPEPLDIGARANLTRVHENPELINSAERDLPNNGCSTWPTLTTSLPPTAHTLLTTLLTMLTHIRSVCTPWSPTNQLLTSPEARMVDYLLVARAWALAWFYVGLVVYAGFVGWGMARAVREVGRCLVLGCAPLAYIFFP
jgi:hypothetical protein